MYRRLSCCTGCCIWYSLLVFVLTSELPCLCSSHLSTPGPAEENLSQELGGSLVISKGRPTTVTDNSKSKLQPKLVSEGNQVINAKK